VDDMLQQLVGTLAEAGVLNNTCVLACMPSMRCLGPCAACPQRAAAVRACLRLLSKATQQMLPFPPYDALLTPWGLGGWGPFLHDALLTPWGRGGWGWGPGGGAPPGGPAPRAGGWGSLLLCPWL
jgi:hypothetical protein